MSRLVQNRVNLSRLIFSLDEFTEDELLRRFHKQQGGDITIDGPQTIEEYLKELVQIGTLSFWFGKYKVVKMTISSARRRVESCFS